MSKQVKLSTAIFIAKYAANIQMSLDISTPVGDKLCILLQSSLLKVLDMMKSSNWPLTTHFSIIAWEAVSEAFCLHGRII